MKTSVLVNGLAGKMATATARAISNSTDFNLFPVALGGNNSHDTYADINGMQVHLLNMQRIENLEETVFGKPKIFGKFAVDYSLPGAGAGNAEFYAERGMPFVMGTTSIDLGAVNESIRKYGVQAVVAPNMALPIVAFQRFIQKYVEINKDVLRGCELNVFESHQAGKKDTSGTAKAMIGYFKNLGINFEIEQIKKIRTIEESLAFGVPQEFLGAHGYHTYSLSDNSGKDRLKRVALELSSLFSAAPFTNYRKFDGEDISQEPIDLLVESEKDKVAFTIKYTPLGFDKIPRLTISHNVNGRDVYANGTLEALRFLKFVETNEGPRDKAFSMIEVLDWIERSASKDI